MEPLRSPHCYVCFSFRLPLCPPAGHPPPGTPLPLRELALLLYPCVPGHKGEKSGGGEHTV